MPTTFVASFFLPYTVDFHNVQDSSRRPSPPRRPPSRTVSLDAAGTASLLHGPVQTPPITPATNAQHEDFFSQWSLTPEVRSMKPDNPRQALVRSYSHMEEWGDSKNFFRQPRSRAGPPLPGDILEYSKAQDRLRDAQRHGRARPDPQTPRSRQPSQDTFEEWTVETAVQGNGPLANAVRATQNSGHVQDISWVGTLGFPTDTLSDDKKDEIRDKLENEYDSLTVYASDGDVDGHYVHYCKTILWPVFHYQIPDHPKSKAYEDHSWKFYVNVNQAFADTICKSYKRGDTIWIHDYHLLLVPAMIRKKLHDARIGFFLHTAFPSSEVFRCLSTRNQLLDGMLGANLVAFQTAEYVHHFLQTCSRLLIVEATNDGVQLEDHFVNVTNLAMGIDPDGLSVGREEKEVKEWIKVIKERYQGKKLIVARDKLDHVRGVRQKLLAFELFLNKHPEYREKVVMLQVATSTTDNTELVATVSDIITRIDSVHSTLAHQPLVFLKQDIGFSQYLALLSVADVLMITPLREGMNLTAHEFIFCQDGKDSGKAHGPVVLSEFTGSAAVFGTAPLIINPWDYQKCAQAVLDALEMPAADKKRRYDLLLHTVKTQTGAFWCTTLQNQLRRVHEEQYKRDSMSIPRLSINALVDRYRRSRRRLFILDYEGTLAPYGNPRTAILTSPQRVIDTLADLLADPLNTIYLMSGRTPEELDHLFATHCPTLGIICENGCFLKPFTPAGLDDWTSFPDLAEMAVWKAAVSTILRYYADRVEGSWLEQRHCALVLHYADAPDLDAAARHAGDAATHINDACDRLRVRAVPVDRAVLVEPRDWNKSSAAQYVFNALRAHAATPDFLMVAGDDRHDEAVFRWANRLAADAVVPDVTTVSVGVRNTEAHATLTQGTTGLLTALQRLAKTSKTAA